MYDIISILKSAVEQEATFKIRGLSFVGPESDYIYRITSCELKTYWLKPCMEIVIRPSNSNPQTGKIISVENNNSIIVKFENTLVGTFDSFDIPAPSFVHGTMPMSNIEIKNAECAMPLCYLFELFTQKFGKKNDVNTYFAENLRIFFLDDYGINDLTTEDHYQNAIYPMQNFAFFVLENLKADILRVDKEYIENNTYKIINRVKTGVFKGTKGNEKSFFTRNLSGVELNLTIGVKKDPNCCECC
jgi:hypothetical protein